MKKKYLYKTDNKIAYGAWVTNDIFYDNFVDLLTYRKQKLLKLKQKINESYLHNKF
jgi:hypothetical protein